VMLNIIIVATKTDPLPFAGTFGRNEILVTNT